MNTIMCFDDYKIVSDGNEMTLEFGPVPVSSDTIVKLLSVANGNTSGLKNTLDEVVGKLRTTVRDIKVVIPNKVVEVTFEDGSKQKAICHEADTFSMERAIEICVMKQIMGGSAAYNNAIRKAIKVWDNQEKLRIAKEEEEKRIAKRRARYEAYKKRCQEKKLKAEQEELARKREESIEMQKEAFVRAFKEIARSKKPDNFW